MSKKINSVTVPLKYPVDVDGQHFDKLTFRRMKAKDALVGEDEPNQARAGYLMYAALGEVDLAVIEELDVEDLETIGERIIPLMGKSAAKLAKKAMDEIPSDGET